MFLLTLNNIFAYFEQRRCLLVSKWVIIITKHIKTFGKTTNYYAKMCIFARVIAVDDEEKYFYHSFDNHDMVSLYATRFRRDVQS